MSAAASTVVLMANPAAGRSGAVALADALARELMRRGTSAVVCTTEAPGQAIHLARAAAATCGTLVAVGGDGTVSEVATGLLLAGRPEVRLAFLPCGTGNDIAHQLGIRTVDQSLAAIAEGSWRSIDVIEVRAPHTGDTPRYAVSFVAAGFAADVVRRTTPAVKRWFGRRLAYSIGFLRALLGYRAPWVRVRLDDQEYQDPCLHVCAGNAEWAGGGVMRLSPGARLDDGRLNLCLIPAKGRREILRNFPRLLRGTFPSQPGVVYREGTTLQVLDGTPMPFQVDGCVLGRTPVRCQVRPGALRMAAP